MNGNEIVNEATESTRFILDAVSRSFAFVIPMLEDNKVREVENQYLLARLIDTVEDSAHDYEVKQSLMAAFLTSLQLERRAMLPEALTLLKTKTINEHDKLLIDNFHLVFDNYCSFSNEVKNLSLKWLSEMSVGMLAYQTKDISTFNELDDYCYYVAGTVGLYLTELTALKDGVSLNMDDAKRNGRFLQKVNIIKDFRSDYAEERVFWPSLLFKECSMGAVVRGDCAKEERLAILDTMTKNALSDARHAFDYIASIPKQLKGYRNFCLIPALMAYKTLMKMQGNDAVVTSDSPVKIGRPAVSLMLLLNRFGWYTNARITSLAKDAD